MRAARGVTSATPSYANSATNPHFELERSAARYFGIRTFAAHINGLVRTDDGIRMWLGRRSPHKAVDPGLLDNMVGGGIPAGASVEATMIKEAGEEAGIPAPLAATARATGTLRICRAHPKGLERETVYVHDLWLDPAFVPVGTDGEVVEFRLEELSDAARLACNRDGSDVVTADASLVIVDCLMRHGFIADGTADHAALDALRRVPLEPANHAWRTTPLLTAAGAICLMPSSRNASRTAFTACRISSGPMAPMQPTRNVSTCVNLPGYSTKPLSRTLS